MIRRKSNPYKAVKSALAVFNNAKVGLEEAAKRLLEEQKKHEASAKRAALDAANAKAAAERAAGVATKIGQLISS